MTSVRQCTRTATAPAVISTGQEERPCRQCLTEGKSERGGGRSQCRLSRVRRACHGAESARPDFPWLTGLGNPRQTDLPSSTPTPTLRFHPHNKFHLTSEKSGPFFFFFFFLSFSFLFSFFFFSFFFFFFLFFFFFFFLSFFVFLSFSFFSSFFFYFLFFFFAVSSAGGLGCSCTRWAIER